jgi:hypothetical protein
VSLNARHDIEARIMKKKAGALDMAIVDMMIMMDTDTVLREVIIHESEVTETKSMTGLRSISGIQKRMIGGGIRKVPGLIMGLHMRGGSGKRRLHLRCIGRIGRGVRVCTGRKEERRGTYTVIGCTTRGQKRYGKFTFS